MVKPCDAELFLCTLQPQAAGLTPIACGYNKRRLQRQEVGCLQDVFETK